MAGVKGRKSKEQTKICRLCGKEFQPIVWNSTVCYDKHYKTCEICGKRYELDRNEKVVDQIKRKTCYNKECIRKQKQKTKEQHPIEMKCKLCGKKFFTANYKNNICNDKHYKICSICGEQFELDTHKGYEKIKDRDFCYKKECIEKHKSLLIKNNENVKRTQFNGDKVYNKTCLICGEQFVTDSPRKFICPKEHHKTCKVCGNDFILKTEYSTGHKIKAKRQLDRDYCYSKDCILQVIQDKIKKTSLERYGTEYAMQTEEFKERSKDTRIEKYGSYLNMETLKFRIISKINKEFGNLLEKEGLEVEYEFPLESYSYDIHIKDTNILIEIDPTYTHNSTIPPKFKTGTGHIKDRYYHKEKSEIAKRNGFQCIHIFDWDDIEKVAYLLKNKKKISGHKTYVKDISREEANEFLDRYHLQGKCRGNDINIGLLNKQTNELLSVITFGVSRYNKNYQYEFLRYASQDYIIHGGLQKLWKYFIEKYNPQSIISYCDNAKFEGKFFEHLGFKYLTESKPTCHWYRRKTKTHITDNLLRQRGADRLLGTSYGSREDCGLNNKQIMRLEGFVGVYDCGQSAWVWERENII